MLTIIEKTDTLVLASYANVMLQSWRREVTIAGVRRVHLAARELFIREQRKTYAFAVVGTDLKFPSEETRTLSAELMAAITPTQCVSFELAG